MRKNGYDRSRSGAVHEPLMSLKQLPTTPDLGCVIRNKHISIRINNHLLIQLHTDKCDNFIYYFYVCVFRAMIGSMCTDFPHQCQCWLIPVSHTTFTEFLHLYPIHRRNLLSAA